MSGQKRSRIVQLLLPLSVLVTRESSDQLTAFSTELYAVQLQFKQTNKQPHPIKNKQTKKPQKQQLPQLSVLRNFPSKCKKKIMKTGEFKKREKNANKQKNPTYLPGYIKVPRGRFYFN